MQVLAAVILLALVAGVSKMVYDVQKSKEKRRMKVLAGIEPDPDILTQDYTQNSLFINEKQDS